MRARSAGLSVGKPNRAWYASRVRSSPRSGSVSLNPAPGGVRYEAVAACAAPGGRKWKHRGSRRRQPTGRAGTARRRVNTTAPRRARASATRRCAATAANVAPREVRQASRCANAASPSHESLSAASLSASVSGARAAAGMETEGARFSASPPTNPARDDATHARGVWNRFSSGGAMSSCTRVASDDSFEERRATRRVEGFAMAPPPPSPPPFERAARAALLPPPVLPALPDFFRLSPSRWNSASFMRSLGSSADARRVVGGAPSSSATSTTADARALPRARQRLGGARAVRRADRYAHLAPERRVLAIEPPASSGSAARTPPRRCSRSAGSRTARPATPRRPGTRPPGVASSPNQALRSRLVPGDVRADHLEAAGEHRGGVAGLADVGLRLPTQRADHDGVAGARSAGQPASRARPRGRRASRARRGAQRRRRRRGATSPPTGRLRRRAVARVESRSPRTGKSKPAREG